MSRLPTPGGDAGTWGTILNDYLSQAHQADGTLKPIPQSNITGLAAALAGKLDNTTQAKATLAADTAFSTLYGVVFFGVACSDETTVITTGTAKMTFRMPFAMVVSSVRANLNAASTSGSPAIDVNLNGTSIFSTTLTLDANVKTSTTAAVPAVLSTTLLGDDDEIKIDIDTAGTGAKGLKLWFIGTRVV